MQLVVILCKKVSCVSCLLLGRISYTQGRILSFTNACTRNTLREKFVCGRNFCQIFFCDLGPPKLMKFVEFIFTIRLFQENFVEFFFALRSFKKNFAEFIFAIDFYFYFFHDFSKSCTSSYQ